MSKHHHNSSHENANPASETQEPKEAWTELSPEEAAAEKQATAEPKDEATKAVDPVAELEAKLADANDKFLRLQAEFQNFRRRAAKESSDARRLGVCESAMPFLQLFDLVSMALKAAEKSDNIAAIQQGLIMILNEYSKALDELGIHSFDAVNVAFDPTLHDAISYEASETVPEGIVIKQWNCGYKLGDKLLRPARVIVSSGAPSPEAAASTEPAEAGDDAK